MAKEYIDIRKLIADSDSGFLKRLPGFVISIIARIIRQREINRLLEKYSGDTGTAFLPRIIEELNITVKIEGEDNMPVNGKCIFAANHPFGIADGLVFASTVSSKYGDLRAIGNDVFLLIPQLRPIIAAVNVFQRSSRSYLTELDKVYKSEIPVMHFPSGLVSRLKGWRVEDSAWQKSFITKAVEYERDIVPVFFPGRNSFLFYFIYLFRKVFGIKTNLELVLLPHEFFNKRNKTIRIVIGKPVSFRQFDRSRTNLEWARWFRSQAYDLKKPGISS